MTEVRTTIPASQILAGSASSRGAIEPQAKIGGKDLPHKPESIDVNQLKTAEESKVNEPKESLDNAVSNANEFVQSINRNLQFSVDEDSERTVIKVLDGASGELIRQIPEDIFLELARRLRQEGELQILNVKS